jgi:hypothetical protein|tara:strand:+ start:295 stop:663 length:369 start_codon:yes stop_codon:yes gene_type:complete
MRWLTKIGIAAFIGANSKIFFRLTLSSGLIFVLNLIYSKYEALLIATNPENLFIPLYIFTFITILLIVWTLFSFKWFASFNKSREVLEVQKSFDNKPDEYKKFADISKYPNLKIKTDNNANK